MPERLSKLKAEYLRLKAGEWSQQTRQKLIEDFTFHSTRIEGLQLTYGDTLKFLSSGNGKKRYPPERHL